MAEPIHVLGCRKCGVARPLTMYPKDRTKRYGIQTICKRCHMDYRHQLNESGERVQRRKVLDKEWDVFARTQEAINNGEIHKTPCTVCGSVRHLQPRYRTFSNHLDVEWRCKKHIHIPYGHAKDHH